MFDFAPVGGLTALAGLAFVALIGWRFIPKRDDAGSALSDLTAYLAELTVPEDSKLLGQRLAELDTQATQVDVAVIGLSREGRRRYGSARNTELRAGDTLLLEGTPDALDEFRTATGLRFAEEKREERLKATGDGLDMVEVVASETSRITGRTAERIGLNWRQGAILMGLSRNGQRITKHLRKTEIKAGDILLLLTPKDRGADITDWLGCLPLADRGLQVTADQKSWLAIGLFAGAIAASAVGLLYLPIALGIVVAAYVLTKIVPLSELYTQIEWPVVVLLGSMIPLGAALEDAGGTELIAGSLVNLTEGLPAWAILTVLMVVTMTLSDVLNNTATAIVAAPVGIHMANSLGASPDPFLMAVAVAASAAFLTPIGHKNNTLILGPGGYRFGDYWRMGLPLEILVVAVSIPSILLFWPL